jgi:hypothetical protein
MIAASVICAPPLTDDCRALIGPAVCGSSVRRVCTWMAQLSQLFIAPATEGFEPVVAPTG